jgi:hypothetical protein
VDFQVEWWQLLLRFTIRPSRWGQHFPSKCRSNYTYSHRRHEKLISNKEYLRTDFSCSQHIHILRLTLYESRPRPPVPPSHSVVSLF